MKEAIAEVIGIAFSRCSQCDKTMDLLDWWFSSFCSECEAKNHKGLINSVKKWLAIAKV